MQSPFFALLLFASLSADILGQSPVCHVPGKCEGGFFLGFYPEDSYYDCQELCKGMPDCEWFSQVGNLYTES